MRRKLTAITTLAAAVAAAVLLTAPPPAAAGNDNVAVAIATKDGQSVFRVRLSITRANGDVVSSTNAAVAYSSCTGCSATAIAFQVVLITDDASVITPTNLALAENVGCNGCTTVAQAYQWVRQTDGQVRFTADGSRTLAQVRHDLQMLRNADLSLADLQARLDALAADVAGVLAQDVVAAGNS